MILFTVYLRRLINPLTLLLSKIRIKYAIVRENTYVPVPNKPIIFAVNHTNSCDLPIAERAIGRHCYVLVGKQRLYLSDRIFFFLNGAIWIDRNSKEDARIAKRRICDYLNHNIPIIWFPEGTWNLTPEKIILPLKWGIIEVAASTGAQIIPLALEYDRCTMTCSALFGNALTPNSDDDKRALIEDLRNVMASLRWELWEKYSTREYDEIEISALKKQQYAAIDEYPLVDQAYEESLIFKPYTTPEEVFDHLKKITPSFSTAFLFRKENIL